MAAIRRLKNYAGPALLSYGFRPFFLLGALYAGVALLVWLLMFFGLLQVPTTFAPRDWHVHEMLYGYLAAVITGFLLTAIPNWTGQMPLQGAPLLGLVAAWLLGRVAISFSAYLPSWTVVLADLSFLGLVAAACTREIMAGKNWRNLRLIVIVVFFFVGNAVFHIEVIRDTQADIGIRLGISAALLLVILVGGRVIPSFTHNWLKRHRPGRVPASFGRFDAVTIASSAVALLLWTFAPGWHATACVLLVTAILQIARLARWTGYRTFTSPLVAVLHVAYLFVPLGFLLNALTVLGLAPASAGIHAWTGGAIGMMTLAIMTRAALGHTGRALIASTGTKIIYAAATLSVLLRIAASIVPEDSTTLLVVAGIAWLAAFFGFVGAYAKMLSQPRIMAES